MISIVRRKCGIPINDVFFSTDPAGACSPSIIQYFIQASQPAPGFRPFKTQIIDLQEPPAQLFSNLSSNTRYKIRRAEREGIVPSISHMPTREDIHEFAAFFDLFAAQKGLPASNVPKLLALQSSNALVLSAARDDTGTTLVAHAYVCDPQVERARLLYSASHFRGSTNPEERNRIGRANRLLHWYEMEGFRRLRYRFYDLGGIPIDQSDPEKNAIARFKSEFGGHHVVEYNGYTSSNPLMKTCLPILRRLYQ